MFHTNDDFLNAIEADPTERTLRLAYADWLAEHDDSRGELIRIEEEMRQVPVFADRFWELKPRRNQLRALAGSEWCGLMRYGTGYEPVFQHGIPDGWRERWRLIREFTERWYRIPMADVGDRQMDVARTESRLGKTFPPSVREWIAFGHDLQWNENYDGDWRFAYVQEVFGNAALSLWYSPGMDGPFSDSHWAVLFSDLDQPDPPVYRFTEGTGEDHNYGFVLYGGGPLDESVTMFALRNVFGGGENPASTTGDGGFTVPSEHVDDLCRDLNLTFPHCIKCKWGNCAWYETDAISFRIEWSGRGYGGVRLILQAAQFLPVENIPGFLWHYARRSHARSGVFARYRWK